MNFNQSLFEDTIRKRLEADRLSVRGASKIIGIGASTLSRILSGENPNISSFMAIATWLNSDITLFFDQNPLDDRYRYLHDALLELHIDPKMANSITELVKEVMY